tara:strand:+ start:105 stop:425 length:321 start_codon:yes stop_codon:yes gene_type:complete
MWKPLQTTERASAKEFKRIIAKLEKTYEKAQDLEPVLKALAKPTYRKKEAIRLETAPFIKASHFSLGLSKFGLLFKVVSLIVVPFALSDAKLNFHPSTLEIELEAN